MINTSSLRPIVKLGLPFANFKHNGISQYFGENPQIYSRFGLKGHNGLDFVVPLKTPILAVSDGTIFKVNNNSDGYGIYVGQYSETFDFDGRNVKTDIVYGHMLEAQVKEGDFVKAGQVIGLVDSTGFSTDNHLHLGVRLRDKNNNVIDYDNGYLGYFDPYPILENKISWKTYWLWQDKCGGEKIDDYDHIPVNINYGSGGIDPYDMLNILPYTSWIWLLARLRRMPTRKELTALTLGRWDYDSVFKNKVGDWWIYYTKDIYELRVKNGWGL
jgi:murein DD-endopeptidase MepM/ murein hydrolase activator NlpD